MSEKRIRMRRDFEERPQMRAALSALVRELRTEALDAVEAELLARCEQVSRHMPSDQEQDLVVRVEPRFPFFSVTTERV